MIDQKIPLLILAMAVVTYIPRAIPAVLLEKLSLGPRGEKFLKLIPYTAMAALIWPGVLTVEPGPSVALAGAAAAALLAWWRCSLLVCVVAAIAVVALGSWAL